jgi:hypothetical protein
MMARRVSSRLPAGSILAALALIATVVLLAACTSGAAATSALPSPIKVINVPYPSRGPYVAVAVDNHFHDIHPEERNVISENRVFVVKNEGGNLHNFTVVGTPISFDIKPGQVVTWARIGDRLKPGSYQVVCKYHAYVGMSGAFIVTP